MDCDCGWRADWMACAPCSSRLPSCMTACLPACQPAVLSHGVLHSAAGSHSRKAENQRGWPGSGSEASAQRAGEPAGYSSRLSVRCWFRSLLKYSLTFINFKIPSFISQVILHLLNSRCSVFDQAALGTDRSRVVVMVVVVVSVGRG